MREINLIINDCEKNGEITLDRCRKCQYFNVVNIDNGTIKCNYIEYIERIVPYRFYRAYCVGLCKRGKIGSNPWEYRPVRMLCNWETTKDGCLFKHSTMYEEII